MWGIRPSSCFDMTEAACGAICKLSLKKEKYVRWSERHLCHELSIELDELGRRQMVEVLEAWQHL